jgi:hypothetical protein
MGRAHRPSTVNVMSMMLVMVTHAIPSQKGTLIRTPHYLHGTVYAFVLYTSQPVPPMFVAVTGHEPASFGDLINPCN